jgi:pyruvate kinase
MKRNRYSKIVATLGPASSKPEQIRDLFLAGVDVFRMNFSHGTQAEHKQRLDVIRELEEEYERPIGVFADMQGPKLRIGTFKDGPVELKIGQTFALSLDPCEGDATQVALPHPEIFAAINAGEDLLINDGRIRLTVTENTGRRLVTTVQAGGLISERKGVNVPGTVLPIDILTEKDLTDMEAALTWGVEWIALSFVQRPEDLVRARDIIAGRAKILSKLEKPSALNFLEDIVNDADAIMVARGDLGVELPLESVPGWQKRMVRACRRAGKPVSSPPRCWNRWSTSRCPPAPRCPTSPPPCSKAPTRSCCRPSLPLADNGAGPRLR